MPNLGIPTSINRERRLNRFQLYSRLSDALYWSANPSAEHLRELADSFSSDLLNLAILSGRLIRSAAMRPGNYFSMHEIIDIGVDVESYFVMLQTACDIMADVTCTLAVKQRGQAPHESFHRLQNWAIKQLNSDRPRINVGYAKLITRNLPWFTELNGIRNKLIHRGNRVWIYTAGRGYAWSLHGIGSKIKPGIDLLSSLQSLTRGMLEFSHDLSLLVVSDEELKNNPLKRIIDGLYVPALHHLLSQYQNPEDDILTAHCLRACEGYVEAAFIGYPDGFWWSCLLEIARALGVPMRASRVFVRSTGAISDCRFVFTDTPRNFGIVACDVAKDDPEWREWVAKSAHGLRDDYVTTGVVVAARYPEGEPSDVVSGVPLVIADDPVVLAKKCLMAWGITRPDFALTK